MRFDRLKNYDWKQWLDLSPKTIATQFGVCVMFLWLLFGRAANDGR